MPDYEQWLIDCMKALADGGSPQDNNILTDQKWYINKIRLYHQEDPINKLAGSVPAMNANVCTLVWEENPGQETGHFWVVIKRAAEQHFEMYDSLGRARPSNMSVAGGPKPTTAVWFPFQGHLFQHPDSDTCGAWCIYSFMRYGLKDGMPKDIMPVEYSGLENDLGKLGQMQKARAMQNEKSLFKYFLRNLVFMAPKEAPHILHTNHVSYSCT